MRRLILIVLLAITAAASAEPHTFFEARSFASRKTAEKFIASLDAGMQRNTAFVVPMKASSGRNFHVLYQAIASRETPRQDYSIAVQLCDGEGLYTCAGTLSWMTAAGRSAVLVALSNGHAALLFDPEDDFVQSDPESDPE